jgi:hypothetical protein
LGLDDCDTLAAQRRINVISDAYARSVHGGKVPHRPREALFPHEISSRAINDDWS